MKFQVSTLTALCALSSAKAKDPEDRSKKWILSREIGRSRDETVSSYVPRKILRSRHTNEEARVSKALKNGRTESTQ